MLATTVGTTALCLVRVCVYLVPPYRHMLVLLRVHTSWIVVKTQLLTQQSECEWMQDGSSTMLKQIYFHANRRAQLRAGIRSPNRVHAIPVHSDLETIVIHCNSPQTDGATCWGGFTESTLQREMGNELNNFSCWSALCHIISYLVRGLLDLSTELMEHALYAHGRCRQGCDALYQC